jgi:peptidoglycan/LPS O-acetylase OafA/YrhL
MPPPAVYLTPRHILALLLSSIHQILLFAIPSFLRRSSDSAIFKATEKPTVLSAPKRSTEYLDGVRGLASVVVFIFHWTHIHFPSVNSGYDGELNSSIWQLPFLRFFYSGSAMVSIFFTVSGFVLTHRFIQKMHRGEFASLYPSLTSITFRRAVRLFLPAFASCILAFICASLGLIPIPSRIDRKKFHHGIWALLQYIDKESDPWTWDLYMKGFYNPQLWSISLEFRGSMVIFLTVLALAKTRLSVRLLVQTGLFVHTFMHKRWDLALFIAGMFIAEMDVLVQESSTARRVVQRKSTKLVLVSAMMVGIWISGYPRDNGPKSFGYMILTQLGPHSGFRRRFWVSIGSVLMVGPLPFFPRIQAIFNTKVIKYFGKVSFALYLIHGLGNKTVGMWILRATWRTFGKEDFSARVLSYLCSTALYLPIIFWWSDMFWRAFDLPTTHFAKWIESKCASQAET